MTDCAALTTKHGTPCMHRGVYYRDGKLYCWQHDPERMQRTRETREAREQAERDKIIDNLARKAAALRFFEGSDIPTDRIPVGGFGRMAALLRMAKVDLAINAPLQAQTRIDQISALLTKLGVDP